MKEVTFRVPAGITTVTKDSVELQVYDYKNDKVKETIKLSLPDAVDIFTRLHSVMGDLAENDNIVLPGGQKVKADTFAKQYNLDLFRKQRRKTKGEDSEN